jgi:hypothetical protein
VCAINCRTRDVSRDAIRQAHAPVLDQFHDAGRRRHDLGQRGDVENGVEGHRLRRRVNGAPADRLLVDDTIAAADEHDRARQLLLGDRLFHDRGDRLEPADVDTCGRRSALLLRRRRRR